MSPNLPVVDKMIVMSDIHFGASHCILNADDMIAKLIGKMKDNEPDEVILLGDIFDFFLPLKDTFSKAKVFFSKLQEALPEVKVTYIPGNHDHHVWSHIIEKKFFIDPILNGGKPDDEEIMTNAVNANLCDPYSEQFLKKSHAGLRVVYPYAIRQCGVNKRYYFTHGHLLDDIFTLGGSIVKPNTLAEIEAFSAWWVEGGWFYLGRAGRLNEEFRNIYEKGSWVGKLRAGIGTGTKALLNYTCKKIKGKGSKIFDKVVHRTEKGVEPGYIIDYIQKHRPPELSLPITFIYGHTHEHKEEAYRVSDHECTFLNTGTWLKENKKWKDNSGFYLISEVKAAWIGYKEIVK